VKKIKTPSDLEGHRQALVNERDPKKQVVRICCTTGCRAGGALNIVEDVEKELANQGLEDRIEVKKTGCRGYCENGPVMAIEPEPQMLLNGGFIRKPVEDVVELLDSIQSKYVAINYDTTHIYRLSKGDPVGYLKALKGRVGWTHLADNDGSATPYLLSSTHLVFGEGNVDMQGVMKTLKDTCGHLEWLDVDVWENPKPFETARENKRILESILERISWTNCK